MVRKGIFSVIVSFILIAIPKNVYSGYESMKSLEGIKSVKVAYKVRVVGNLTEEQIKNDTELKLLQSKIKMDETSKNILAISIDTIKNEDTQIASFVVSVSLDQIVILPRNAYLTYGSTWSRYTIGFVGVYKIKGIREYLKDILDSFIIDYLKANTIE